MGDKQLLVESYEIMTQNVTKQYVNILFYNCAGLKGNQLFPDNGSHHKNILPHWTKLKIHVIKLTQSNIYICI